MLVVQTATADDLTRFRWKTCVTVGGNVNITGITTATQLFEGTTRVATTGKAIAMAMLFG